MRKLFFLSKKPFFQNNFKIFSFSKKLSFRTVWNNKFSKEFPKIFSSKNFQIKFQNFLNIFFQNNSVSKKCSHKNFRKTPWSEYLLFGKRGLAHFWHKLGSKNSVWIFVFKTLRKIFFFQNHFKKIPKNIIFKKYYFKNFQKKIFLNKKYFPKLKF